MNKRISCFFVFLFIGMISLQAQNDHIDHDHDGHKHGDFKNEIGAAVGVVFNLNENNMATGFHFHYMRSFGGKMHNFGISPGVGFLIGTHRHYTLHLMFVYRPIHGWWIGAGPGITYFEHHNEWGFSGHIETGYEFEAGKVHLGPVIEYSWAKEDQHIMLGLHLGIPF